MDSPAHSAPYEALRIENEALRAENQALGVLLRAAQQETAASREQLAKLEHELSQLKRLLFGTKSERFVPAAPVSCRSSRGAPRSRRRKRPAPLRL